MIVNLTTASFINPSLKTIGVCNVKHAKFKANLEKLIRPTNYKTNADIKAVVNDIIDLLRQIRDINGIMLSPTMNGTAIMAPYFFKKMRQEKIKVWFKFSDDKDELILVPAPL